MTENCKYQIDGYPLNSEEGQAELKKYTAANKGAPLFCVGNNYWVPKFESVAEPVNSDSTAPIKGMSLTPPMTGSYECTIQNWSGNTFTVSNEVRFYSVRCGWLKGQNEVVIEYKLK